MRQILLTLLIGTTLFAQTNQAIPPAAPQPDSAAAATAAATTPASTPTPQVRPTTILVSAMDPAGNAVALSKDSVTVMDSGRRAELLDVRSAEQLPVRLAIILLGRHGTFGQQKNAAIDLVNKVIRPGVDQVLIVTAGGSKPWTKPLQWESDPAKATELIKSLDGKEGLPDAFDFSMDTDSANMSRITLLKSQMNDKSVFELVWGMMMADPKPARRVLVTFRNPVGHAGGGLGTRQIAEYTDNRHAGMIAFAQAIRLPIFAIAVEDSDIPTNTDIKANYTGTFGGDSSVMRNYDERLARTKHQAVLAGRSNIQRLADETGGRFSTSTKKNFSDAIDLIANSVKSQYALTFVPSDTTPTPRAVLDVTSGGQKVQAPKAYPRQ